MEERGYLVQLLAVVEDTLLLGIGRRTELVEGGGDHATGSGGFSAGGGDFQTAGYNGFGSFDNTRDGYGAASGYYTLGTGVQGIKVWFNQGGMWSGSKMEDSGGFTDGKNWYLDYSGSGGDSGTGGEIYYSNKENIHSYNGDRVTNSDYDTILYEYEPDGTETENVASVLTKLDGSKFVQTKIFAQDGILRAIYRTNQAMTKEDCEKYGAPFVEKEKAGEKQTENIKINDEEIISVTDYGQGIGSRSWVFRSV